MLTRWLFPVLFNTPDDTGAAEPPVPEPVVESPPAPSGPWAADVETFFTDPNERARVDQFMREKYQPYVTRLEQDSAPARALYDDLVQNPVETLGAIAAEVYGDDTGPNEDLGRRVVELLNQGATPEAAVAAAAAEQPAASTPAPLPPEVQEIIEERKVAKQQEAYQTALAELKGRVNDDDFDDDIFGTFVVMAEGNLEQGYGLYTSWRDAAKQRWGTPAPPTPPTPDPPAPLGSTATGDGTPTPPVQKKYASMDEALDDFFAEQRAARGGPTVVGSV